MAEENVKKSTPKLDKLKGLGSKLVGFSKEHPYQALGTGALGAANVAGLLDNPNIAGQLVGAGLGAAAPALASKLNIPYVGSLGKLGKVNSALIGGGIGSLFDTLMAKKAEEEQMMQMYGGA